MEAKWEDVMFSLDLATLNLELAESHLSDAIAEFDNTINMLDRALGTLSAFRRKYNLDIKWIERNSSLQ